MDSNLSQRCAKWLDRCALTLAPLDIPGWLFDIRLGLICFLISLFLASPALWQYLDPDISGRFVDFMAQAENPLRRDLREPILGYRIVVPFLNHVLGLRSYAVALPAILASLVNLILSSRIIRRLTKDRLFTFFSTASLTLTFYIVEGTTFWMSPDSVAHMLVLIAAAFRTPAICILLATLVSMLIDERAIFSISFLLIFDIFCKHCAFNDKKLDLLNLFSRIVYFAIGIITWKLFRGVIDSGLLAPPPTNNLLSSQISRVLLNNAPHDGWSVWIANIFCAFKWVYLYPVLALFALIRCKENSLREILFFCSLFLFSMLIVASAFNGDVWRTVSFGYLFVIQSIVLVYLIEPIKAIQASRLTMLGMLATPSVYFGTNLVPQINFPLPLVLVRTVLQSGTGFMTWLRNL